MQNNNRPIDVVRPPSIPAPTPASVPPVPSGQPIFSASPISTRAEEIMPFSTVTAPAQPVAARKPRRGWLTLAIVGGGALALVVGGVLLFARLSTPAQSQALKNGEFNVTQLPLAQVKTPHVNLDTAATLKVNGQLQVANSVVFTPSLQPSTPTIGQLYYDKNSNQFAYYNGQQFQNLGGTNTSVTNVLGSSQSSVLLQQSSPGVQQTGNINISGTANLGAVATNIITSNGGSLFINPTSINTTPKPAGVPFHIGLDALTGALEPDPGWKNGLNAQKVTLGDAGGKLQSMSAHFVDGGPGDHVQFAVYEDDGDVPSKPGARLAASAVVSMAQNDWTTASLPAITLSPNTTYWIAVNTDSATARRYQSGGGQNYCYIFKPFGAMPDPFQTQGCFGGDLTYPLYATFLTSGGDAGTVSQAHMSIDPDGAVLFRNSTDASNAFQIQNAAGTNTIFNVDTINGRIAIGKSNAAYKLDIAGGDINLSNGRSLRFGGLQALTTTSSGITALSSLTSGGGVRIQGDSFSVQDRAATHTNLSINNTTGATIFSNLSDSTNGFQIQNATGTALFRADTSGMNLYVGDPAGSNTPVVLYLANKNTAGDPATGAEGGTYYNSTLGSFRCFHTGFWQNCADIEPQHSFSLYDDFMGGQTSFTGNIGSLGWTAAAIGSNGSLVRNPATPTPSADRPGILQIQTPASSNQGTTLMLADTSGGSALIAKDNDVKTSVAVGAATGQVLRIGLHAQSTATTQPVSGVWWEADPAANANWRYCFGNGTTATCAASSVAIAANTWVTLEIRVTATGSGTSAATFVINNVASSVSAVTIDTTNRVSPALSCYATTSSAQTCTWDYFQFTGTTSARR